MADIAVVRQPVPSVRDPRALAAYIERSLQAMDDRHRVAQGGVSLYLDAATTGVANSTPRKITEWNTCAPPSDYRSVACDLPNDRIVGQRPGLYALSFNINAEVDKNQTYEVRLYLNGVAQPLVSINGGVRADSFQQFQATGLTRVYNFGDTAELYVTCTSSGANQQFDMMESFMCAWWVGD